MILDLHVQPGASRSEFAGRHGERIKVRLAARAVDGKANEALVAFLSDHFKVPRRSVRIVSGLKSGRRGWRSMADEKSLKTLTTVVYALQARGFIVGSPGSWRVVIDYVKRDEAEGHLARVALPLADPHLLVGPALGPWSARHCS